MSTNQNQQQFNNDTYYSVLSPAVGNAEAAGNVSLRTPKRQAAVTPRQVSVTISGETTVETNRLMREALNKTPAHVIRAATPAPYQSTSYQSSEYADSASVGRGQRRVSPQQSLSGQSQVTIHTESSSHSLTALRRRPTAQPTQQSQKRASTQRDESSTQGQDKSNKYAEITTQTTITSKRDQATYVTDSAKHMKMLVNASTRLLGEIAFRLEMLILQYVFRHSAGTRDTRLYGYLVKNIPEKIAEEALGADRQTVDQQRHKTLNKRYNTIKKKLAPLGFEFERHPDFCLHLVSLNLRI